MKFLSLLCLMPMTLLGAVSFDGVSTCITMGPTNALDATNFTISAWIYITGRGVTATSGSGGLIGAPIVCKGVGEADGSNLDANYFFAFDTNSMTLQGDFEDFASGANHPVTGVTAMAFSTWYHVGLVHDLNTSNFSVYLNGVPDGTIITNSVPRADNIQHFGIGTAIKSSGSLNGFFKGIITDVAMWNTALTTNEMLLLAKSKVKGMPLQIRYSNLKGYWPLDNVRDGTTMTGSNTVINRVQSSINGSPLNSPLAKGETALTGP